jgi:hypothetical protein
MVYANVVVIANPYLSVDLIADMPQTSMEYEIKSKRDKTGEPLACYSSF